MDRQVRVASGLSVLFGLWLIVSPFLVGYYRLSNTAMWDAIIVGVIVVILSAIRYFNPMSSTALSWIGALLGLWLIVSLFVLGIATFAGVLWDFIIVGIAFIIFDAWAALVHPAAAT